MIGTFTAEVCVDDSKHESEFHVVKSADRCLLGCDLAVKLGLLWIKSQETNAVETVDTLKIVEKYSQIFNGVGKLKNFKLKLHIDKDVTPVAQTARRIPFVMRKKVEKKLAELETMDIIEKVDEPTSRISPIVVAPKPSGDIRLCVDMRMANTAIMRERHPIPTVDEVLSEMNGAKVFSKIDLNVVRVA